MKRTVHYTLSAQRGMAIISAIFILVVLAAIGAFAVQMSTMQHFGSAQDVQSVRAYQAARAGIEWALFKIENSSPKVCPAASTNMTLSGDSFTGLTVTVSCNIQDSVAHVISTACNQPVAGACPNTTGFTNMYIERQLDVKLRTDID